MTVGTLDPITNPGGWQVVTFAGRVTTDADATLEWSGWSRPNKWDVKEGKGTAGATETYVGKPPARGKFTFGAYRPQHFRTFDQILALLNYDPIKKNRNAIDIYHPALADIGVHSVVPDDDGVGAWEHKGGGMYERTVAFLEFFPTVPANTTATPATSDSTANTPGTAPDPATAALQKQLSGLTGDAAKAYTL